MEILDNTEGKRLVDSLRANLDDEAKLSIISAHFSLFADDAVTHKDDALFGARYESAAVRGCLTGDGEGLPDAVSVYVVGGGRRGSRVSHSIVS